jgi:hypothetical protein
MVLCLLPPRSILQVVTRAAIAWDKVAGLHGFINTCTAAWQWQLTVLDEKMATNHLEARCDPALEDEALLIETSGEMPQVALAESLQLLGRVSPSELACLQAAAVRCYLRLLARDLDPASVGLSHFRGLERACQNLARLGAFLDTLGWSLPASTRQDLAGQLQIYLAAEAQALDGGRAYATCQAGQVRELAQGLGLDLGGQAKLLERLEGLSCPDFRGLIALRKLSQIGRAHV